MTELFKDKYKESMDEIALESFRNGESVTSVCVNLGICRDTYYDWKNNSEHPFSRVAKLGEALSQQWWENKGKDAVFGGVEKFAGSSWQFVMRNRFRDDYSDAPQKDSRDTLIDKLLATKDA